jgi:hypothetical protein
MGQATVDLPDPMQSPAAPATAGTDDLLAQLAGEEIERLLAETETERPAPPAAAASPMTDVATAKSAPAGSIPPTALPSTANAATPADALLPTDVAPAAANAAAELDSDETKENLTSQLDALFESLNDAATPPAPPTPAPAETPAAAPAPSLAVASAPEPIDIASSPAELKALGEPIAAAAAAALPESIAVELPADAQDNRPSLLVRLLEFINSPLGQCSDPVRQAVGKIAIATLLNAIAVLAYTLMFRHR